MEQLLFKKAIQARNNAYAPYSNFKVGAAILMEDNNVITGCNIENASYGLSNCAERTAMFKMISEGYTKADCKMMLIVGDTIKPISPCGACRQVMNELLPKDMVVVLANINGEMMKTTVKDLLPYSFDEVK